MKTNLTYTSRLDLAYGTVPKQRLDIYLPKGKIVNAPVFLFVHGGGFREGDKAHYGPVAGGRKQPAMQAGHQHDTRPAINRASQAEYHPVFSEDHRAVILLFHGMNKLAPD